MAALTANAAAEGVEKAAGAGKLERTEDTLAKQPRRTQADTHPQAAAAAGQAQGQREERRKTDKECPEVQARN